MPASRYINDRLLRRQDNGEIQAAVGALELYRSALWRARLRRWWSVLTGQSHSLLALHQPESMGTVRGSYAVGICAVPVRQIRGSESRSDDFDADFCPRQQQTRGRWLSIATARLLGVTMPPVELLQVRGIYYVRDGHHRISVARAMGQEYIEAEVKVWELGAQPLCARPDEVSRPKPKALCRFMQKEHNVLDAKGVKDHERKYQNRASGNGDVASHCRHCRDLSPASPLDPHLGRHGGGGGPRLAR
jgi:hypothetical protein